MLSFVLLASSAMPVTAQEWGEGTEWQEEPWGGSSEKKPEDKKPQENSPGKTSKGKEEPAADEPRLVFSEFEGFHLSYLGYKLGVHALFQGDLTLHEPYEQATSGFDARRAYVSVKGTIDSWFDWQLEYDLADGNATNGQGLRDCYGRIAPQDMPIRISAGYLKPAYSWEEFRQDPEFLTFVEPAAHVQWMAPGRRAGVIVEAWAQGAKKGSKLLRAWLGVHNGSSAGVGNTTDDWGLSLMVEADPLAGNKEPIRLHLGASCWVAEYANSTSYWGADSDQTAILFGPYAIKGITRQMSAHVNFYYERLAFMFEYTLGMQARKVDGVRDLPPLLAQGYHVDAIFMILGHEGKAIRMMGMNRGLEACLRFERYELNDVRRGAATWNLASTGFFAPNVQAARLGALTIGVNWYADRHVRLTVNLQTQWIDLESQRRFYPLEYDHRPRSGGPRLVWVFMLQLFL